MGIKRSAKIYEIILKNYVGNMECFRGEGLHEDYPDYHQNDGIYSLCGYTGGEEYLPADYEHESESEDGYEVVGSRDEIEMCFKFLAERLKKEKDNIHFDLAHDYFERTYSWDLELVNITPDLLSFRAFEYCEDEDED